MICRPSPGLHLQLTQGEKEEGKTIKERNLLLG